MSTYTIGVFEISLAALLIAAALRMAYLSGEKRLSTGSVSDDIIGFLGVVFACIGIAHTLDIIIGALT